MLPILQIWIHYRWFVYYRITKAKVQSDKFEEAMATMESLRESIGKINGLVSSNLVQISETEMIGVAAYESKEHLEASQEEFNELMANMMPYMAGAPEVSFGEGIFSFKSWATLYFSSAILGREDDARTEQWPLGRRAAKCCKKQKPAKWDDKRENMEYWNIQGERPIFES